jgi:hypothetical protein
MRASILSLILFVFIIKTHVIILCEQVHEIILRAPSGAVGDPKEDRKKSQRFWGQLKRLFGKSKSPRGQLKRHSKKSIGNQCHYNEISESMAIPFWAN